jgi:glycosyltransferase involved in cell wall biosynthesis
MLQLRALRALRDLDKKYHDVRLIMVGSARNIDDETLVRSLKSEATVLGITENVEFLVKINVLLYLISMYCMYMYICTVYAMYIYMISINKGYYFFIFIFYSCR